MISINKEREIEKDILDNLNKKIESQIKLGSIIKSFILEEILFLAKVETQIEVVKKSYANATKASTTPALTSGLKSIVKEARYEEIKEKRDHDQRQRKHCNPWSDK